MPNINAIIEGSGTSGGGVAGLLKNDAAARAAENAATLSVQAAVGMVKLVMMLVRLLLDWLVKHQQLLICFFRLLVSLR